MNTILDQIGLIVGTEEGGVISVKDNAAGRILSAWMMTGVPGIRGTIDNDAVIDTRTTITPDEPLFGLALLDHFEEIGWTVWTDDELLNNVFCPTGPGGGVDATCSPGKGSTQQSLGREGTHQFPTGLEGLKTIGPAGGSTGAMIVEGENGQRYLLKRGKSEGHLRSEGIAGRAYEAAEIGVPEHKIYETETGPVKLSIWAEGTPLKDLSGKARQEAIEKIKKGFAVDVALANWDVIGLYSDNILVTPKGNVLRIDNGGALEYRAGGKLKGSAWNKDATEFETLRNNPQNSSAVEVFGKMTKAEIDASVDHLIIHEKKILAALPEHIRDVVKARISSIVLQNHDLQIAPATPPKPASPPPKPVGYGSASLVIHPKPPVTSPGIPQALTPQKSDVSGEGGHQLAKHIYEGSSNLKLTELHLRKISFLNPNSVENGVFYIPIIGRTASAPSHVAAREHIAKLLPPGTIIKNRVISAKQAEGLVDYKSFKVSSSSGSKANQAIHTAHGPYHSGEVAKDTDTLAHYKKVADKLTPAEYAEIKRYKGSSSYINEPMRDCPPKFDCLSDDLKESYKHLESALAKAPILPEAIPVTRRFGLNHESTEGLKKLMLAAKEADSLVSLPSFSSCSRDATPPMSGNIFLKIQARTGLHIVKTGGTHSDENEFLQSPHVQYRVTKIESQSSTTYIYLEEIVYVA